MLEAVYSLPFSVFEVPLLRVRKPSWVCMPQPMTVFGVVLVTYFLVTGGLIYDVIVEPPSTGQTTDENGHSRIVAFMAYRVNGQYIMEGLASAFMFAIGALGFIILEHTHVPQQPKFNRVILVVVGFACVAISFIACYCFMKVKLPGYLKN